MVEPGSDGWCRPEPSGGSGFTVESERVVHRGFVIDLVDAKLRVPDGSAHRRDVIRHPGAVSVVPLHDDDTVTLVRQFRVAPASELWEIPAGKADRVDEPPDALAGRELREEVGLHAASIEWLAGFYLSPGYSDEWHETFVATGLTQVSRATDGPEEEHLEIERFSLADVATMLDNGTIIDAKTIIALSTVLRGGA